MTSNWEQYYKKIKDAGPRPLLVEALVECKEKNTALDIGAGSMNDTIYLLEQNFKQVIAVDSSEVFLKVSNNITQDNLVTYNIPIEKYDFTENYFDIINAQFSLPFVGKEYFNKVMCNIESSLKKGGIFCGQLFGDRDSWNNSESSLIFHTKNEIDQLIHSFEILKYEEIEKDGFTAIGNNKHWHFFNLVLRKI